jgi:hypothetical protein
MCKTENNRVYGQQQVVSKVLGVPDVTFEFSTMCGEAGILNANCASTFKMIGI